MTSESRRKDVLYASVTARENVLQSKNVTIARAVIENRK